MQQVFGGGLEEDAAEEASRSILTSTDLVDDDVVKDAVERRVSESFVNLALPKEFDEDGEDAVER